MLKIKDVCKAFGNNTVLQDITFEIGGAKIIGLAGSSGSGKSTLLRLIQKLENPDSGTIENDVRTGFMFQDFQLFPHMTVWQNITYSPALHNKEEYIAQAKEITERLSIAHKIAVYPAQLSGGQKQRAALARSLMMNPGLLLCDEPTSGLDVATIQDVVSLLESIRGMGVCIIIASHDLDFLTQIADEIFVLKNGKLVKSVVPKNMENPIHYLKNLYYEAE